MFPFVRAFYGGSSPLFFRASDLAGGGRGSGVGVFDRDSSGGVPLGGYYSPSATSRLFDPLQRRFRTAPSLQLQMTLISWGPLPMWWRLLSFFGGARKTRPFRAAVQVCGVVTIWSGGVSDSFGGLLLCYRWHSCVGGAFWDERVCARLPRSCVGGRYAGSSTIMPP